MKTVTKLIIIIISFCSGMIVGLLVGRLSCDPGYGVSEVLSPIFEKAGLITPTPTPTITPSPSPTATSSPTPSPTPTIDPKVEKAKRLEALRYAARIELATNVYYTSSGPANNFLLRAYMSSNENTTLEGFEFWKENIINSPKSIKAIVDQAKNEYGDLWKLALKRAGLISRISNADYL